MHERIIERHALVEILLGLGGTVGYGAVVGTYSVDQREGRPTIVTGDSAGCVTQSAQREGQPNQESNEHALQLEEPYLWGKHVSPEGSESATFPQYAGIR